MSTIATAVVHPNIENLYISDFSLHSIEYDLKIATMDKDFEKVKDKIDVIFL